MIEMQGARGCGGKAIRVSVATPKKYDRTFGISSNQPIMYQTRNTLGLGLEISTLIHYNLATPSIDRRNLELT